MPLNGRSARAGALGGVALAAADFFSGKGNGALSSLAATAGGGVTAISKGNNYRIGRGSKKRHLVGNDKVRKRDTDMRDCARRPAAAGAASLSQHFVKNCVPQARRYNIGRPRGFGPRGNALSSAAISLSLSVSLPGRGIVGGVLRARGFWNRKHRWIARQKTERDLTRRRAMRVGDLLQQPRPALLRGYGKSLWPNGE